MTAQHEVISGPTPPHAIVRHRRALHRRLLAMHIIAIVFMTAGTVKYHLPVSDMSCRVTDLVQINAGILYDVSGSKRFKLTALVP